MPVAPSEAGKVAAAYRADVIAADSDEWRSFALGHPDAFPYHHPAWIGTLTDAYRYEPQAVVMRKADGGVVAGAPFAEVGGRLRGRRWVSLPFTDACPPLTADDLSARDVVVAMDKAAVERGVSGVEIRTPIAGLEANATQRGVVHELALGDPEDLFRALKSNVRRNIRKAESSGIVIRTGEEHAHLTRVYYGLHINTRRRLGVPPQPRRFFDALWANVIESGLGFLLLAYRDNEPIAGAVFLAWNGRVHYKYGASDQTHWALRPNNLLFWEAIRRAHASGARVLDFGRSDLQNEGLRSFKASWGAVEKPLIYTIAGTASGGLTTASRLLSPVVRIAPIGIVEAVGALLYRYAA